MDDVQRPNSLVTGITRAKRLYGPWRGNQCPIEKVLNFPETSMSIQVKSVVYSSRGGPWMIFRVQFINYRYNTCKASLCSLARQSLPYRESPQLSRDQLEHTSKECCLQLQERPMDDIQRPNSLVTGIVCAKRLYALWHGNCSPIEKVLNFPETSMSIQVKSVVYSSMGSPWMIFRGQVHWLLV
jgi:hypothetical protein